MKIKLTYNRQIAQGGFGMFGGGGAPALPAPPKPPAPPTKDQAALDTMQGKKRKPVGFDATILTGPSMAPAKTSAKTLLGD